MAISPVLAQAIMETAKGPDIMGQFQAGQEAGFQRQERERQVEVRDLLGQAYGGEEGALEQLGTLDPEKAFQLQNMFNTRDNQSTSQLFKDAVVARNLTGSARQQFMADRAKRILRSGGDPAQTLSIMEMSEGEQNATLDNLVTAGQASGVLPQLIKAKRNTAIVNGSLIDTDTEELIFQAETTELEEARAEKLKMETEKLREEMESLASGETSTEDKIKIEKNLRQEVFNRSKDFEKVDDAWTRIKASAKNPSPSGDMALIFNFMKMLDPGSTVREGEYAAVAKAAGMPERMIAGIKNVVSGNKFGEKQRKDFVSRAETLFKEAAKKNSNLESQYKKLSKQYGVDPLNVILGDEAIISEITTQEDYDALPSGATYTENGIQYRKP